MSIKYEIGILIAKLNT